MSYGFNLKAISLKAFSEILKTSYLIPSMRVLLEGIDPKFHLLENEGIYNVEVLYLKIKTKKKAEMMAEKTGIDPDYMIVLRRMVSSYIPKPRKLVDYPDISPAFVEQLKSKSIKSSIELYAYLSDELDSEDHLAIDNRQLEVIRQLMEISRLRYISPAFATVLVRSRYDSIEKIAGADSHELHEAIVATNKREHIYGGNVGDSDARFLVDDAAIFLKYKDCQEVTEGVMD